MPEYKMSVQDKVRELEKALANAEERALALQNALQLAAEREENQQKELDSLYRAIEAKTVQVEDLTTRLGMLDEEKEDFRALFEKKDRELAAAMVYKEEYHALLDSLLHGGKMQ